MTSESLFELAFRNDSTGISNLVLSGADPNEIDSLGGHTPLHVAVFARATAAVEALLAAGANPNMRYDKSSQVSGARYEGRTVLMYAKSEELVELLVSAGADLNLADRMGWTALAVAVEDCNVGLVRKLIELGAEKSVALPLRERFESLEALRLDRETFLRELLAVERNTKTERMLNDSLAITQLVK